MPLTITKSLLSALMLSTCVSAHTYLIKPRPRQSWAHGVGDELKDGTGNGASLCHLGDGTPTCCVSTKTPQMTTYKRGDTIDTHWWRNNHVGGFIRYSIVPIDQSDDQDAFDDAENMINYECNQVGCTETYGGSAPNNWNGGDSHGNLGWSNICNGKFVIPYHLKDGTYTVQWVWFGQGNGDKANSPFQSCIDLVIKGGATGPKPACPLWQGGDTSEAGDEVCTFVSVDSPTYQGSCVSANACSGKYTVGVPAGLQQCVNGNAPKKFILSMAASKGVPNTFSSYISSGGSGGSTSSTSSSSDDGNDNNSSSSNSSSKSSSSKTNSKHKSSSSKKTSKKCSRGSIKRRHYGKRSSVRRHGLDWAYSS